MSKKEANQYIESFKTSIMRTGSFSSTKPLRDKAVDPKEVFHFDTVGYTNIFTAVNCVASFNFDNGGEEIIPGKFEHQPSISLAFTCDDTPWWTRNFDWRFH